MTLLLNVEQPIHWQAQIDLVLFQARHDKEKSLQLRDYVVFLFSTFLQFIHIAVCTTYMIQFKNLQCTAEEQRKITVTLFDWV